ncbi:hypothetical protein NPIL_64161 [Nephila pilipes]|uniref:Uncharacterized protein n=1 Tax=Nephila pilipes TaxID=299642 RepID=A0A8X6TU02_NEPPI|nr:hypothetical protein NPIL_64161 [Nephila pilipes]
MSFKRCVIQPISKVRKAIDLFRSVAIAVNNKEMHDLSMFRRGLRNGFGLFINSKDVNISETSTRLRSMDRHSFGGNYRHKLWLIDQGLSIETNLSSSERLETQAFS